MFPDCRVELSCKSDGQTAESNRQSMSSSLRRIHQKRDKKWKFREKEGK